MELDNIGMEVNRSPWHQYFNKYRLEPYLFLFYFPGREVFYTVHEAILC